jgi:hypothetical protein
MKLSKSQRKYIRSKKSQIRRQYGEDSQKEKNLLEWIKKERKQKQSKVKNISLTAPA